MGRKGKSTSVRQGGPFRPQVREYESLEMVVPEKPVKISADEKKNRVRYMGQTLDGYVMVGRGSNKVLQYTGKGVKFSVDGVNIHPKFVIKDGVIVDKNYRGKVPRNMKEFEKMAQTATNEHMFAYKEKNGETYWFRGEIIIR